MSQHKVRLEEDGSWFASQGPSVGSDRRKFGGIFYSEKVYGLRGPQFSVHRMTYNDNHPGVVRFRKFRHAKKCLSKWVNS
jgi:hypothetical protein